MKGMTLEEFASKLASKEPTPGGGGAAALCGSLGAALGVMAANITLGKKKYADVSLIMEGSAQKLSEISARFIELIDEDAQAFLPLSKAYGIKAVTPEEKLMKEATLDSLLFVAAGPPLRMLELCEDALSVMAALSEYAAKIVISDVGCGAQILRAGAAAASLNIKINVNLISDKVIVKDIIDKLDERVQACFAQADAIFERTINRI